MKSKAPLMLMEQMVMLLVFALAAALCLQAFVKADEISKQSEARDRAVVLCQTVAETLKESGETDQLALTSAAMRLDAAVRVPNEAFALFYDRDWQRTDSEADAVYLLDVNAADSGVPGLGKAQVSMRMSDGGAELFRVDVAWQEVSAFG